MAEDRREKPEIGTYFLAEYRNHWLVAGMVLLLALMAIDFSTGFKIHLAILYALPLLIFTWVLGRFFGVIISLIACSAWSYMGLLSGRYASEPALMLWEWGAVLAGLILLVYGLSALQHSLQEAHFASRKDSLTGLVNKGGFYQIVQAEAELCRRYKRTLSIAYIDCDNFKQVNDKFGHHVGDELLRIIAKTMQRKLRGSDLAGRLGGDEFAVMLPETNAESCRMVMDMLQQRLLHEMTEHNWPVTFSIGIATFIKIPPTIDDMIRQADTLMYAVKNTSKGAIKQEVFSA